MFPPIVLLPYALSVIIMTKNEHDFLIEYDWNHTFHISLSSFVSFIYGSFATEMYLLDNFKDPYYTAMLQVVADGLVRYRHQTTSIKRADFTMTTCNTNCIIYVEDICLTSGHSCHY